MTVLSRQSIHRAIERVPRKAFRVGAASSETVNGRHFHDPLESYQDARGCLTIEPFDPKLVQADGVDLRLGPHFIRQVVSYGNVTDEHFTANEFLSLEPGDCVLGSTIERVEIPLDMTGNTLGRSSVGRKFVVIHCTAGSIDPGFKGHVTLEIVNHSKRWVDLPIGIAVAKLQLLWMDQAVDRGYDGRYQDQGDAPVASRLLDGQ